MALGFAMDGPAEGKMQQRPTADPAMGTEPMPEDMEAREAASNVTPEEQQVYDQVVGNALKMISSPKTRGGILMTLQGDGNPEEGLANAAATVAKRVMDSAKQNGMQIPGDIMLPAGQGTDSRLSFAVRTASRTRCLQTSGSVSRSRG